MDTQPTPHWSVRVQEQQRRRLLRLLAAVVLILAIAGVAISVVVARLPPNSLRRSPGPRGTALPISPDQGVAIAADAATRRAFVVGAGGRVSVLDLDSGALLRTVALDAPPGANESGAPVHFVVDARLGHVFVAIYLAGLSMLDARSGRLLRTLSTAAYAGEIVLDTRTQRLFERASNGGLPGTVDIFDVRTGAAVVPGSIPVPIGDEPSGLVVDSRLGHGFVGDVYGNVVMFDTSLGGAEAILHTERGSPNAFGVLAVDERVGRLFAVGDGTRNVSVFDARTDALLPAIPVGADPEMVLVDANTGRAFVANYGDGTVSVLDTRSLSVLRTVAVGGAPLLALDARRQQVIAVSESAVSVLDARSGALLRTRRLALAPLGIQALAVDTRTGRILVVDAAPRMRAFDRWAWLPLRGWLPFIPPPPRVPAPSDQVVMLDERLTVMPPG